MFNIDKYTKTYRVLRQLTYTGEFSENEHDTYIECKNNVQIFRFNKDILVLYIPNTYFSKKIGQDIYKYLTPESQSHFDCDDIIDENIFYFYEKYINQVALIVKPSTKGKDVKSNSIKNLKSYVPYEIKNEKLSKEFSDKFKVIVEENGNSPRTYTKGYDFMVKELIKKNKKDFIKYAEEQEIRPIQAIDALDLFKDCIKLLDDFNKSLK